MNSPLSAFVFDDANLNVSALIRITKYTVFSSIFWGKSPSSLVIITFSPVSNWWSDKTLDLNTILVEDSETWSTVISFTLLLVGFPFSFGINISASLITPEISKNNLSPFFAPILNPCVRDGGLISLSLNPNRYSLLVLPFLLWSIETQSIFSSEVVIALGGMTCVINARSSFWKAFFLNPSETRANCPKFELELVIDASDPDCASKCVLYPIANTETICKIELFDILTCLVSQPLR